MLDATIKYVMSTGIETVGTYNDEFMNAVQTLGRRIACRIYINNELAYSNNEIHSMRRYAETGLLKSIMYALELEIEGVSDFTDTLFSDVQFGVSPDGDTYYFVSYGKYKVYEFERDYEKHLTKITAYDELLNSMKEYELTPPNSVFYDNYDYLEAIATKMGLTLGNTIPSDGVMAIQRNNETYTQTNTFRDPLDDMSAVLGGCLIAKNGKLELLKPSESGIIIDESNLKTVTIKESFGTVTNVVLSRMPQEDNVSYITDKTSGEVVKLVNNGIVEGYQQNGTNNRTVYLEPIYNNVITWGSFATFELDSYGYALMEPCDYFTLQLNGVSTAHCLWASHDIKIDQGFTESAESSIPESSETDYTKATNQAKSEMNTYLIVDKVRAEIMARISEIEHGELHIGLYPHLGLYPHVGLHPTPSLSSFATKRELQTSIVQTSNQILSTVSDTYETKQGVHSIEENLQTQIDQTASDITLSAERSGLANLLVNSNFSAQDSAYKFWTVQNLMPMIVNVEEFGEGNAEILAHGKALLVATTGIHSTCYLYQRINLNSKITKPLHLTGLVLAETIVGITKVQIGVRMIGENDATIKETYVDMVTNTGVLETFRWDYTTIVADSNNQKVKYLDIFVPYLTNVSGQNRIYINNIMATFSDIDNIPLWTWTDYSTTDVISKINIAPTGVLIQGEKIDIKGITTFSSSSSGTTVIDGGTVNLTNLNASNITTGTLNSITSRFGSSSQYVEIKENTSNTGVLFSGTGTVNFETQGQYTLKNLVSGSTNTANGITLNNTSTYANLFLENYWNNKLSNRLKLDASGTGNSSNLYNYKLSANETANLMQLASNETMNVTYLWNYNFSGTTTANYLRLVSDANTNILSMNNHGKNGYLKNEITESSTNGITIGNNYGTTVTRANELTFKDSTNIVSLKNNKANSTANANNMTLTADTNNTFSIVNYNVSNTNIKNSIVLSTNNGVEVTNNYGTTTYSANTLMLNSGSTNTFEVSNYTPNTSIVGNKISYTCSTSISEIELANMQANSTYNGNKIELISNSSDKPQLVLTNYQKNSNVVNSRVLMADSISFTMQNWFHLSFDGNDPQIVITKNGTNNYGFTGTKNGCTFLHGICVG